MSKPKFLSMVMVILLCLPVLAVDSGEQNPIDKDDARLEVHLLSSVLSSAGLRGTSPSFKTQCTLGQSTPIGIGTSPSGVTLYAGFWGVYTSYLTDVLVPEVFENELQQNYPNPFNPSTTVEYTVAETSPISLIVYNLKGEKICTLTRENQEPGRYQRRWDGRDDAGRTVSAGVYFCLVRIGEYESVKKMVMVK